MKANVAIFLSALFWCFALSWTGHGDTAIVMLGVHLVAYQAHRIEVKLNRLMTEQGVSMSEAEINRG